MFTCRPPILFGVVQTGQPMEQLSLVPNLNLRRLIKDLLTEGGEGLYLHRADSDSEGDGDGAGVSGGEGSGQVARAQGKEGGGARRERGREEDREYRFALVAEQILVLKVRCGVTHCCAVFCEPQIGLLYSPISGGAAAAMEGVESVVREVANAGA